MDLPDLGAPIGPVTRIGGGFANRMYRLDTDRGSFAVKELDLTARRLNHAVEEVLRFEQAAFAAGIPMPEPIAATPTHVVHRWVEGEQLPEAPVPPAYGYEVGRILARIHALEVPWPAPSTEPPASQDWPELAERAAATGQPWADDLAAEVETFLAIARFVDTCDRPGPVVLTHRDVQPWNLLVRDGRPVLLDWELSGRLDLSGELGSTALSLAKGRGFESVEPASLHSVLEGYAAGGGTIPPAGPSWFVFMIGGWLEHTRTNIRRCLIGTQADTGPDLELSHEIVRDGIRGLPDVYARLPQLEALLR